MTFSSPSFFSKKSDLYLQKLDGTIHYNQGSPIETWKSTRWFQNTEIHFSRLGMLEEVPCLDQCFGLSLTEDFEMHTHK